jgi:large subunit ribosomal protein L2
VSPWGQPTKGHKTRRNKKTTGMIIRSRHLAKTRGA